MEKLNLITLLTVFFPGAFLNIYVAFVLTGRRSKLYLDDKFNVLRITASIVLMVTSTVLVSLLIKGFVLATFVNIVAHTLIFKIIYSMSIFEAVACTVIVYGFNIAIKLTYDPVFTSFVLAGSQARLKVGGLLDIIYSIPIRIIQMGIVVSFWNWDLLYLNIRRMKSIWLSFLLCIITLLLGETTILIILMYNLLNFSNLFIALSLFCAVVFSTFNFFISRLLINILS